MIQAPQVERGGATGRLTPESRSSRLEVTGLSKSYGGVHALREARLSLAAGSVHAVLGENGAGKSTLVKILAGVVAPDSGQALVDGAPLRFGSVRAAHAHGIHCVYQEISLVPQWTVAQNLLLVDRQLLSRWSPRRDNLRARQVLERFELDIDPHARTASVPLAQRQAVELVRSALSEPRVLILDEATSALTPPEVDWLFTLTRRLVEGGTTVLFVSHRLSEVAELADHGTVMRDGEVVSTFTRSEFRADQVLTQMAGRPTAHVYPALAPAPAAGAPDRLSVVGLRGHSFSGIDVTLRAGEVVGLGGLQGQGQAELLSALAGLTPARADSWTVSSRPVRSLTPGRAVRLGQAFVPEERKVSGLALDSSIGTNLLAPWLRLTGLGGSLAQRLQRPWVRTVMTRLRVKAAGPEQKVGALSGGNQQKVVIGRWLDRGRTIYLLNDPTRGIDVASKLEIYALIQDLAREGCAVLWLSTEVEELVHGCRRVLVMYRGKVVDELRDEQITARRIVGSAIGHNEAVGAPDV